MLNSSLKTSLCLIAGICLFSGIPSAQAALTITFQEDTENGQLHIIFSGEVAAPFDVTSSTPATLTAFKQHSLAVIVGSASDPNYYGNDSSWIRQDNLPWSMTLSPVVARTGAGGFLNSGLLQLYSNTSASAGEMLGWDGSLTYSGTLEDIGLAAGDSGTILFIKGEDSFSIDWVATVPEPSTYAAVLGLGVAGVALLRRRTSRR